MVPTNYTPYTWIALASLPTKVEGARIRDVLKKRQGLASDPVEIVSSEQFEGTIIKWSRPYRMSLSEELGEEYDPDRHGLLEDEIQQFRHHYRIVGFDLPNRDGYFLSVFSPAELPAMKVREVLCNAFDGDPLALRKQTKGFLSGLNWLVHGLTKYQAKTSDLHMLNLTGADLRRNGTSIVFEQRSGENGNSFNRSIEKYLRPDLGMKLQLESVMAEYGPAELTVFDNGICLALMDEFDFKLGIQIAQAACYALSDT